MVKSPLFQLNDLLYLISQIATYHQRKKKSLNALKASVREAKPLIIFYIHPDFSNHQYDHTQKWK